MDVAQRILVIDDDRKITAALRRSLTYNGFEVDVANEGTDGLARARAGKPDLVVLDILMPGLNGLEVARQIRETSDIPILMLTARDALEDRVLGLETGADDYLVKPFAYAELLARIRALLRRRPSDSPAALQFEDLALDTATREVRRSDRAITLTTKEYELLEMLLRNPRRVLTREQILQHVWGFDSDVNTHVLEVYIGYLRQKLEAGDAPRLIHTVRGVGYALKEPAPK